MKKSSKLRKYLNTAMIGVILLGGSGIAIAQADDSTTTTQTEQSPTAIHGEKIPGRGMAGEGLKTIVDELVAQGTITSAQAEAIQAKISQEETNRQAEMEKMKAMTETEREALRTADKSAKKEARTDLLTQLVSDGTIAQEQADTIRTALQTKMETQRQAQLKTQYTNLVTKGIITSEQSTAIQTKLEAEKAARQAEMEKMKTMTETERKAYMEANQANRTDTLKELVTDGTLTQTQADQVAKSMPGPGGHGGPGGPGGHPGGMKK